MKPEKPEHPNLLSGLMAKRNEIARDISFHQERWRQLSTDLISIDQTLRILAPDFEKKLGKPLAHFVPPPHQAFKGEIARLVASAFREANGRPLSTLEIAQHVMRERMLDENDFRLRQLITKRVGACLSNWRYRGRVVSEKNPDGKKGGEGGHLLWRLSSDKVKAALEV